MALLNVLALIEEVRGHAIALELKTDLSFALREIAKDATVKCTLLLETEAVRLETEQQTETNDKTHPWDVPLQILRVLAQCKDCANPIMLLKCAALGGSLEFVEHIMQNNKFCQTTLEPILTMCANAKIEKLIKSFMCKITIDYIY